MRLRLILLPLCLLVAGTLLGQTTIWSHAIGNWRNGPVVYITPLIETTTRIPADSVLAQFKAHYPEMANATDTDILMFATPEEGNESRRSLNAKYGMRKLEVVMLEPLVKDE